MKRVQLNREAVWRGPLVLVNRENPLKAVPEGGLAAVQECCPEVFMERRAARLLAACLAELHAAGEIVPVSGWRSQAEQQKIWDDTLRQNGAEFTRQYVALPGCSEHQTGLAIDLGKAQAEIDFIRPEFPYSGLCQAFRRAALRYGFIERYTREKERVTGIAQEPWHFRYVGAPHARILHENGLCLEEYTAFLKQGEVSCVLENGRRARVFYLPCEGEQTTCALPEGCCQISGNNVDGFVVTVWEVGT